MSARASAADLRSTYTAGELAERLRVAWDALERERERVVTARSALARIAVSGRGSWNATAKERIAREAIDQTRVLAP